MTAQLSDNRCAGSACGGSGGSSPPGKQSVPVTTQHYAFLVSDEEFEAAFGRIRDAGITYYADPGCTRSSVSARRRTSRTPPSSPPVRRPGSPGWSSTSPAAQ